jgi:uncharacterized membrane protein (UPF0127 family)
MTLLNEYLNDLNSDMSNLLSKYDVTTYTKEEDINKGLLRFNKSPKGKAFLFVFPDEKIRIFHTISMKFSIKIYFFDKNKKLINSKYSEPNIKKIHSKEPAMFVVEVP